MADLLGDMRRTHHCNQLGADDVGSEVVLMGWVQRRRDHGGVIFVDLRDREGLTQVVFNPEVDGAVHAKAHALRSEYVIGVRGRVARLVASSEFGHVRLDLVERQQALDCAWGYVATGRLRHWPCIRRLRD